MFLRVTFATIQDKASYLDGAARDDAAHPVVVAIAAKVAALPPAARAEALWGLVRARVRWVRDPDGVEELADAATVLRRGWDDCDGSARALCALALAAGLEARIRAIVVPELVAPDVYEDRLEHIQALLRWPGSSEHPLADPEGWVLGETTLAGVAFGQGAEAALEGEDEELLTV
jgi:transglutaminase-like putative cysteine protease